MKKAFAEVIESSLDSWLVQSWEWDNFPAFGSLVIIENNHSLLFGIVHEVKTGSMDPNRYPFAYQKTEEELRREQPQIFEFLKTTFSCITLGYKENGKLYYHKAPKPPKIHAFVRQASKEELQEFLSDERYLHSLFSSSGTILNIDELLLALLRTIEKAELLSDKKITMFIEQFSLLTGNDYRRLKLFMQRI
jgi:hypothetical protein